MTGKTLEQMRREYFALTTDKDRASPYNMDELERLLIETPCMRAVIYTGTRQRSFMSLYGGGRQLYEVLPWNAYHERMKAIFGEDTEVNA